MFDILHEVLTSQICTPLTKVVADNRTFKNFFLKDARDEEPVISGERELKNFGP